MDAIIDALDDAFIDFALLAHDIEHIACAPRDGCSHYYEIAE